MLKAFYVFLYAIFCVLVISCSTSRTSRVDVDDDIVKDTEVSSKDLRTMARNMAEDLLQAPQIKERIKKELPPAKIAFAKMTNKTRDYDFDEWEILTQIRGYLIQYSRGYMTFLESEKIQSIVSENTGKEDNSELESLFKEVPDLYKADYILTGRAYTKEQRTKDMTTKYHSYTFWLTHVATRAIVWQQDYEVKKASDPGALYGRE